MRSPVPITLLALMLTGLVLTSGARADLGFNLSEGWFQAANSVDGQFFDQDGGISENDGVSDAPSLAVTSPLNNCNPAYVG